MGAPRRVAFLELSETQQRGAYERFAQLQPCLEEGVSISEVARALQMPLSTVQRWVSRYRAMGLVGLAHQSRADRGGRRRISAECVQVIEGVALSRPEWSRATVHREVCKIAQREHWAEPSYGQVSTIINGLDSELKVWAKEGSKVYQERYDLLYLREVALPNDWWQSDHCWLNIWLLGADGRPARPYLTVILDEYSRMIMGYRLSFDRPSAYTTGLVLRQAIMGKDDPAWPVGGIPEHFYTDHGSDYTSTHLQQVAAQLRMQLVFSQPGRPRGRGKVERFFRTVKQLFLPAVPGAYPSERRGYRSARQRRKQQQRVRLVSKRHAELTLEQFDALFRAWLIAEYHHRCHATLKCSPLSVWQAAPVLVRRPEREDDLDGLLLLGSKGRKVDTKGIRFENRRYQSEHLAGYVHQTVEIRYDPADLSEIAVYVCEGERQRLLCRARYQGSEQASVSLKEVVRARTTRRKEVRKGVRTRVKAAREVLRADEPVAGEGARSVERTSRPLVAGPAFLRELAPELLPPDEVQEEKERA
jgi:putative transposase